MPEDCLSIEGKKKIEKKSIMNRLLKLQVIQSGPLFECWDRKKKSRRRKKKLRSTKMRNGWKKTELRLARVAVNHIPQKKKNSIFHFSGEELKKMI